MNEVADGAAVASGDLLWTGVQVFVVLAFIVLLIVFLGRLMRRRMPGMGGRRIRVVEAVQVGPGRTVCLLWVVDRLLVVGSTAQSVQLLAEIDDEALITEMREGHSSRLRFQDMLRAARPGGDEEERESS